MLQPWFKFHPANFLSDQATALLSMEERGALVTLWCFAWRDGDIPADDARLARLLGITAQTWASIKPALIPFFIASPEGPDRLLAPSLETQREARLCRSRILSDSGARGGKATQSKRRLEQARLEQHSSKGLNKNQNPNASPGTQPEVSTQVITDPKPTQRRKAPVKGPNANLPDELQAPFWCGIKTFPKDKLVNLTESAKAYAGIVASGEATAEELNGCMARYMAQFPEPRRKFMVQLHAWLSGAGYAAFLDAERTGLPVGAEDENLSSSARQFLES